MRFRDVEISPSRNCDTSQYVRPVSSGTCDTWRAPEHGNPHLPYLCTESTFAFCLRSVLDSLATHALPAQTGSTVSQGNHAGLRARDVKCKKTKSGRLTYILLFVRPWHGPNGEAALLLLARGRTTFSDFPLVGISLERREAGCLYQKT